MKDYDLDSDKPLSDDELEQISGGIDTVPLPELPALRKRRRYCIIDTNTRAIADTNTKGIIDTNT